MPTPKTGIKELKELIGFGADAADAFIVDGKLTDLKNIGNLITSVMPLIPKVGEAFTGLGDIPKEIGDLDAEEASEIVLMVKLRAGLDDESQAEELAGALLGLVAPLVQVVSVIRRRKSGGEPKDPT